jgi:hypothetical protein
MFNVITPLARLNNFIELKNHLKKFNINWHIITDEGFDFDRSGLEPWIKHYVCPNTKNKFYERCNYAINWFIENFIAEELNDQFFCILNDDDGYEDNFFDNLKKYINESEISNELIICSMKRGDNTPSDAIPERKHPTYTLIADPRNVRIGGVGVEQFITKGKILKKHKLPLSVCGDGELIIELYKNYGAVFYPDLYVLFNYFEPGRWNKL